MLPLCLAVHLAGCDEPPSVEVSVVVTSPDVARASYDPDAKARLEAQLQAQLRRTFDLEETKENAPAAAVEIIDTEPPTDAAAFGRLLARMQKAPLDELAVPIHNLAHSDVAVWPELRSALAAEPKASKTQFSHVLQLIGGDVPNRYGHFALHWKRDHGYSVKLSEDWFGDLQSIAPGQIASTTRPVYRELLAVVAMMHGAARIGREAPETTGEVVESLLDLAYAADGTFRDEVGRAIQAIGDEAVPHLVLAAIDPHTRRDDDPRARRAQYAAYNLDKLDRLQPQRALRSASADPRRLEALLRAYATARPGDAAAPILDYVDHDAPRIRRAAKEAFMAYVSGPPPKMEVRLVRRLGGVVERRQSHLSYRALATIAIRERMEVEAADLLEPACEVRREDGSYDQRCIGQPERLANAWFGRLDEARSGASKARLEAALANADGDPGASAQVLDELLLEGLDAAAKPRVADFFLAHAERNEDPVTRGQLLRKAAALHADPKRADALRAAALVAEAESPRLDPRGRAMLLRRAREFDSRVQNASVVSALPELSWTTRWAWSAALMFLALCSLGWLSARRKKPAV